MIPANTIIEFAGIYGFQVDFQRDIRKNDKFQIMFEIFLIENNEVFETNQDERTPSSESPGRETPGPKI